MKSQALFIAQPRYETKTWDDLPLAAEAASKLAVELAARGYELGYQDLLSGGDKQAIEKRSMIGLPMSPMAHTCFWSGRAWLHGWSKALPYMPKFTPERRLWIQRH
jgi:hypothetical protein